MKSKLLFSYGIVFFVRAFIRGVSVVEMILGFVLSHALEVTPAAFAEIQSPRHTTSSVLRRTQAVDYH